MSFLTIPCSCSLQVMPEFVDRSVSRMRFRSKGRLARAHYVKDRLIVLPR